MLSIPNKRILQGPSMIIDAKNFKHIFEAIQFRQFHDRLHHVKVTLNRAYLDRLEQFLQDLPEAELKLFALDPTTTCSTIRQMVSYPLACKAFAYILEEGVKTFIEIVQGPLVGFPLATYQQQEVLVQEKLKSADNTSKEVKGNEDYTTHAGDTLSYMLGLSPIPRFNCFQSSIGPEEPIGPRLSREVLEQENHSLPSSIENGA